MKENSPSPNGPKRSKLTAKEVLTLLGIGLAVTAFLVAYILFTNEGDRVSAFTSAVSVILFLCVLFAVREIARKLVPPIPNGGRAQYVRVVVVLLVVGLGVLVVGSKIATAFENHVVIASLNGILRTQGTVETAEVLHYDSYKHAFRNNQKIDSFQDADFTRVFLKLPDGSHTDLTISRGYPGYGVGSVIQTYAGLELENGTMKVRYWRFGAWLVRPEVEFSQPTQQEACNLLGPNSRVCHL
jgi:hypothetical protein